MSSNKKLIWLTLVSLAACLALITTTTPRVESSLTIFSYFISFFSFLYFCILLTLNFIGVQKSQKLYAGVISSVILVVQVLTTFKALRTVELILVITTFMVASWYFSKRNTR